MNYNDIIMEGNDLFYKLTAFYKYIYENLVLEYDELLARYFKICEVCNDIKEAPLIKFRLAYYFKGLVYVECASFTDSELAKMQLLKEAESQFSRALKTSAPPETDKYISTDKIKTELVVCYTCRGYTEPIKNGYQDFLSSIWDNPDNHDLSQYDIYRVYMCIMDLYGDSMNRQDIDKIKCLLQEIYQDILDGRSYSEEYLKVIPPLVELSVYILSQKRFYSEEQQRFCLDLLKLLEEHEDHLAPYACSKIAIYRIYAALAYQLNVSPEKYILKCLKAAETEHVPNGVKAEVLQMAALFFYEEGNNHMGDKCINQCLDMIVQVWHAYAHDIDNTSLYQELEPMQLIFRGCYSSMRKYTEDIGTAYEKVLQFKDLASFAQRERNRFLPNPSDDGLVRLTYEAQNKAAGFQARNLCNGTSAYTLEESIILRSLEASAAGRIPIDADFTDITLQTVEQAIPDESVVIEYFFYENDFEKEGFSLSSEWEETSIDIYVVSKRNGRCAIKRFTVPDGETILKTANNFVKILEAESNPPEGCNFTVLANLKEAYRKDLYHKLIEPTLPYMRAAHQIFIAPDHELVNLPFGVLGWNDSAFLEEEYDFVIIECARDFLFCRTKYLNSTGSLIIGNPQYRLSEQNHYPIEDECYAGNIDEDSIPELPFSEVEAERVSHRCKCRFYSGSQATKRLLYDAKSYKNIHIATHCYFDLNNMHEASYSSFLLFAGAENFLNNNKESRYNRTGIFTADEISRLDLHSVELVVLSTCFSSMNQVLDDKGFHGLIEAFSAAGVRYIISHLWSADDFSPVILMDYFYYQYMEKGQTPPVALHLAKKYLREVTMRQLRKNDWFLSILDSDKYSRYKFIQDLKEYDDCMQPFAAELFWGGYSCYRCN